jgi:hypothetical protein
MKYFKLTCLFVFSVLMNVTPVIGQTEEDSSDENKPTRAHFESAWLIENQTVVVPRKKTLEFMIQHRFGDINSGAKDMWGLYLPSNIRLGLSYTLLDNVGFGSLKGPVAVGYGTTKDSRIQDFSLKYAFLQQTRNGSVPVSVTYFTNMAIETEKTLEELPNRNSSDRYSFFHQILISRRITPNLSVQVAPSVSHYNVVNPLMNNDHYAVAVGGRYKISPQSSFMFNVDQPITTHEYFNPQPVLSFGFGVATSAHSFQVFITNSRFLIPQKNNMFNQNDPWKGEYFIGFNINRLWAF